MKIVLAGTPFSGGPQMNRGNFVVARYLGDGGPLVSTPFSGQPVSVPAAAIEAKNFDNGGEGVAYHDTTPQNIGGAYRNSFADVLPLIGASNGYAVGYTDVGEWLKYTINVTAAGTYVLQSRVASDLPGGTFHIELDGTNVTGTLNVPDTDGWSNWQTLTSRPFTLSLGSHVMRLVEDTTGTLGAVANFDTFMFAALPGLPDPSFGVNGVVTTSFGAGFDGVSLQGLALQPDGKILVAGNTGPLHPQNPETDFTLARYTSVGALNDSFGQGGIVSEPGGMYGHNLAVQPDGKILLYAAASNSTSYTLLRYTSLGLPDSSFGVGGNVPTDISDPAIAVRPDGRIVLAGTNTRSSNWRTELASYLPNGQPDPSFGTGGKVFISTGPAGSGARAMTLQPDGKIDFVGIYNSGVAGTFNEDWYLARLNADGTPDSSFGTGGTVVTDFGGPNDQAFTLICEGGGDIIVAGYATVGSQLDAAMAFYTSSGALDLSRGTAGKVTTDFGWRMAVPSAIAAQPADGKILLAAGLVSSTSYARWGLARYTPAGNLDPTFGSGGVSVINVVGNSGFGESKLAGMALQDDGKIVVAGTLDRSGLMASPGDFIVARYLGDVGPRVSTPFSAKPVSVPDAIIEAENFDNGGEGVAYHDTTPQNLGGAYRNSFVDLKALAGASNGYAVGYTDAG